ncbi:MAG: hypothetical protein KF730_10025 [Sphingomonas sp.]|uniref:hypothetical protein n=1 Tax=Sphingomonas sp. TaxID=28214 RepID=UPI0025DAC65B|nr:hypothetical protein [Sphingomonas sp.]MBX3564899.1 hypothetical protein [Sphingomonas sp.]
MRQNILIFLGLAAMLLGVLFMLQGLGVVRWPASSTMIDQRVWLWRGLALAVGGAIVVGGVRLVPTRAERKAARREGRDLD